MFSPRSAEGFGCVLTVELKGKGMGGVKALQFFDSFSGLALRISGPALSPYL